MLIAEGWPGCFPVLDYSVFTVDTLYYGGKNCNINSLPLRYIFGHRILVVLLINGDTGRLDAALVNVKFF